MDTFAFLAACSLILCLISRMKGNYALANVCAIPTIGFTLVVILNSIIR